MTTHSMPLLASLFSAVALGCLVIYGDWHDWF